LLAQFNQRLQLFPFGFLQKAFVVAVHQFLKALVCLRWKMEIPHSLYPVNRMRQAGYIWRVGFASGKLVAWDNLAARGVGARSRVRSEHRGFRGSV
jgi:hypothetical protein